jgi:hypothetical protein
VTPDPSTPPAPPALTPVPAPAPAAPPVAPAPGPVFGRDYGPLPSRGRNPAMAEAGQLFAILGIVSIIGGAILLPVGAAVRSAGQCESEDGEITFDCDYGPGSELMIGGAVSLTVVTVGANVFLGMGIPLFVLGNAAPEPPKTSTFSPAGLGLQGSF